MKQPIPFAVQAGLVMSAIVALVVAVCFVIVLGMPRPAVSTTSVREMATAWRDASSQGGERRFEVGDTLPPGRQSVLIARMMAEQLQVDPSRLRAFWNAEVPASIGGANAMQALIAIAGHDVVVDAHPAGFSLRSGESAILDADTPVPAFHLAMHRDDGRWQVLRSPDTQLSQWRMRILAAFVLSVVAAAPLVAWLARSLTRSMRQLAEATVQAGLEPGGDPFPTRGPREVLDVARAVIAMRARLAEQAAERTRMLVAVAHDLRNPLTGLRLRAERTPPDTRDRMVRDIDRMSDMVMQVLDYARPMAGRQAFETVELGAFVTELVEDAGACGRQIRLTVPADACPMRIERSALRRAIDNLLDNAARYAGAAEVNAEFDAERARIVVADRGPGIPAAELPRLFEPFERLEQSRSRTTGGIGLGLSIARNIVAGHGGQLRLENRIGGGLAATIELPRVGGAAAS